MRVKLKNFLNSWVPKMLNCPNAARAKFFGSGWLALRGELV